MTDVIANVMCQIVYATVLIYLAEHYFEYFCKGVFEWKSMVFE